MKTATLARAASCLAAILISSPTASAQETAFEEPWIFTLSGMASAPLNDPSRDQFGVGGGGAIGLYRSIAAPLAFGLRVGAGALSGGGVVPQDRVDRGVLDWGSLSASMRVRPFGPRDPGRRASGLWLEVGAGPWLVDGSVDPVFDAGLGYGIELGSLVLAPLVRFTHVLETHGRFGGDDVLVGSAGLEIAWNDRVPAPAVEPETRRAPVCEPGAD